jgi:hypothetical protein
MVCELPTVQLKLCGEVYEVPSTIIELLNNEGDVPTVIDTVMSAYKGCDISKA